MIERGASQGRADPAPMRVVVDELPFERAGAALAQAVVAVLAEHGRARLAIPGGSALAAATSARASVGEAWRQVRLTWVDERCVPLADAASNRGAAVRLGLIPVAGNPGDEISPASVLPLFEDGETPQAAVERVRMLWARDFHERLDVVLLGMGEDGHVASLFPSRTMPTDGWVAHVADSPKPPSDRITLTRAALATAEQVVLVAAGESKRDALERLLAGEAALPARGLPGLIVVTDLALDA